MLYPRLLSLAGCRNRFAGLRHILISIVLLSPGACNDQRPPQPSNDPGTIARNVVTEFLSLPDTEVTLVSLEAQKFSDSSLGCPEPNMAYQQVVTPGHRVIVEAEGRRFDVRVAGSHGKICRNNKQGSPKTDSSRESAITTMMDNARRNLAGLLDVDAREIRMLEIHPYDGKRKLTGCSPQCASRNTPCGYLIGLIHDGRRYEYHAIDGAVAPCPPILRM